MRDVMRRIRRNLRGPSVLPKRQRNRAVLFRTRFTTIRRSEIHISLNVDADALTDACVGFLSGVQYIISVRMKLLC